jgi:hypothetical protein
VKSLTESPAVLSVHAGSAGQFIIRVADLRDRPLITGVTKLLTDAGASSFVVVTPSDIKVFNVGGSGNGNRPVVADPGGVDSGGGTGDLVVSDAETQAAIDAEESRPVPGAAADLPTDTAIVGETPQGTKVVRRPRKPPIAGHAEACGRCAGTGRIAMILDGGAAGETACPVCKGAGTLTRYGNRR